jgi:hypothetical protein
MCVDAGGMHGGLTVGRLARESLLCSIIAIVINPTKVRCYLSFGRFCTSHIYSSAYVMIVSRLIDMYFSIITSIRSRPF